MTMRAAALILPLLVALPAHAQPAPAPPPAAAPKPLSGGADFISPMGEPVRSKDALSGAEHWFAAADADHDGRITAAEMRADADRFFTTLDTDHDDDLGPDEIVRYESVVAPEIAVSSTYGDPALAKTDDSGTVTPPPYPTRLGAGRFGYLDMPEPVISADANMDRGVTRAEFESASARRLTMLDTNGDGVLTRDELPDLKGVRGVAKGRRRGR